MHHTHTHTHTHTQTHTHTHPHTPTHTHTMYSCTQWPPAESLCGSKNSFDWVCTHSALWWGQKWSILKRTTSHWLLIVWTSSKNDWNDFLCQCQTGKFKKAKTAMYRKIIGLAQNVPLAPIFKELWCVDVWMCVCVCVCLCVCVCVCVQSSPLFSQSNWRLRPWCWKQKFNFNLKLNLKFDCEMLPLQRKKNTPPQLLWMLQTLVLQARLDRCNV